VGGASDSRLRHDIELIAPRDREGYGRAVLGVHADGSFDVETARTGFDRDTVSQQDIAALSTRQSIERVRHFVEVQHGLRQKYRAQGMNEGQAALAASGEMEDMGLLPKGPTIAATEIAAAPAGQKVFTIRSRYFRVGLFQDIAAAIASPGKAVKSDMGDYLGYSNDDVGVRLKTWRRTHSRFVVEIDGVLWQFDSQ